MSHTTTKRRSGFAQNPQYRVAFEPCAKRLRVRFNGETLADTTRVRLMRETGHVPVYYFPRSDVRMDLLAESDHATFCPYKGEASYWHVAVGGRRAENAVWSYESPFDEVAQTALITVGYTKGTDFKPASRPPIDTVLHWDAWGGDGA